jgi:hypothetical protein
LEVTKFPGTRMYRNVNGRVRLTWKSGRKIKHARIRLNKGYLNPRWISLPKSYPIPISSLKRFGKRRLYTLGIVRLDKDDFRLLIFQQLDDLFSLFRQLVNYTQPRYVKEEAKLYKMLDSVKPHDQDKEVEQDVLVDAAFDKLEEIGFKIPHIAGRVEAVKFRIRLLNKTQELIKGRLESLLEFVPEDGVVKSKGTAKGVSNSLRYPFERLARLSDDKPYAHRARWSGYHITKAQELLLEGDIKKARYHMQKAINHL